MKFAIIVAVLLGYPALTFAGEAHVCTTETVMVIASVAPAITDQTKFKCPGIGERTIPQLAALGWRISLPLSDSMPQTIVTKSGQSVETTMMILIQKP